MRGYSYIGPGAIVVSVNLPARNPLWINHTSYEKESPSLEESLNGSVGSISIGEMKEPGLNPGCRVSRGYIVARRYSSLLPEDPRVRRNGACRTREAQETRFGSSERAKSKV